MSPMLVPVLDEADRVIVRQTFGGVGSLIKRSDRRDKRR